MPTLEEILAGLQIARNLIEQYDKVKDTLSEGDQAVVEDQLRQLQAKNDSLFQRLNSKLEAASKR